MRRVTLGRLVLVLPMFFVSFVTAQQVPPGVGGIGNNAAYRPQLPPWMKRGLRVTFFQGAASIPSAGQVLVPTANGGWANAAGQTFSPQATRGAGGGGYSQLTVVGADERNLAAETRMFLLLDPANGKVISHTYGSVIGTPEALGEYWIHPARLAAIRDMRDNGATIARTRYPLGGQDHNAIVMETRTANSFTRYTYDTDSGLLLCLSTCSVGGAVFTPNANGTSSPVAGAASVTSTILTEVRQLNLPWMNEELPGWIGRGRQLAYAGTYGIAVPGAPVVPMQLTLSLQFGDPCGGWVPAKMNSRLFAPNGQPAQDTATDRALGAATNVPQWINPQTLRRLQPGQVLDEDRATRFRTTFGGVQGNVAILNEQGPMDRLQAAYDLNSGLLIDFSTVQSNGVGETRLRLQFSGQG